MEERGYDVVIRYQQPIGNENTSSMEFGYEVTVAINQNVTENDSVPEWGFEVDVHNGTAVVPIGGKIYNHNYGPEKEFYTAYLTSPWSTQGAIFDGIDWKQVLTNEMPGFIEFIQDATGLEPENSQIEKIYS